MHLFLVTLCAIAAVARAGRPSTSLADDSGLRAAVLWYMKENVRATRLRDETLAAAQGDDEAVVPPGFFDVNDDDFVVEDEDEVENDLAISKAMMEQEESSSRSKRSLGEVEAPLDRSDSDQSCSGSDHGSSLANLVQQQASRLKGIHELLAFKREMFHGKLTNQLRWQSGQLGERILTGHGLGLDQGVSCCPNLPCCSYKK